MRTKGIPFARRIGLLLVLVASSAAGQSWQELAPMPEPRAEIATAVMEDTLYFIGGLSRVSNTNVPSRSVLRFNLNSEEWLEPAPSLPSPRFGATAAMIAGRLYLFGGRGDTITPLPEVLMYDPYSARWDTVGYLPVPRFGMRSHVLPGDSSVYLSGGGSSATERSDRIDVVQPRMQNGDINLYVRQQVDTLPTPRAYHGVAVVDSLAYVIGGHYYWPLNDAYRREEGGWVELDTLAAALSGHAVSTFTLDNEVVLVVSGGENQSGVSSEIQMVHDSGVWFEGPIPELPTARRDHIMIAYDDNLLVFGGSYQDLSGERQLLSDAYVYRGSLLGLPEAETRSEQPHDLALGAWPNPFNGSVQISLRLPATSSGGELVLYNLMGQPLHRWSVAPAATSHTRRITWNGRRQAGELPGGSYFLRLRSGASEQTIKLVRLP